VATNELTPAQIEACHMWLTRKAAGLTAEDVAKACGIDRRTLYRWRNLPAWRKFESEQAVLNAKSYLNDVLEVVVEKAIAGSAKHAEMYLKVCGLLGNDAIKNAPTQPETDPRSNEAMEAELAQLHKMLAEINGETETDTTN
jgi:transcriptional regulator with XRE-family HTH domain